MGKGWCPQPRPGCGDPAAVSRSSAPGEEASLAALSARGRRVKVAGVGRSRKLEREQQRRGSLLP